MKADNVGMQRWNRQYGKAAFTPNQDNFGSLHPRERELIVRLPDDEVVDKSWFIWRSDNQRKGWLGVNAVRDIIRYHRAAADL